MHQILYPISFLLFSSFFSQKSAVTPAIPKFGSIIKEVHTWSGVKAFPNQAFLVTEANVQAPKHTCNIYTSSSENLQAGWGPFS